MVSNAQDVIAQALARTEQIGRWPTVAELAQMRHDNAAFAKALGAVLALADDYDRAAHRSTNGTDFDVIAVHRGLLVDAITAALSEVTP